MLRSLPTSAGLALFLILYSCASSQHPESTENTSRRPEKPPEQLRVLDAGKVLFAIRGGEIDVRKCFLRSTPRARGFVRLGWHVDREGKAFDIEVEDSTPQTRAAVPCLTEGIEQVRFARADETQRANWTFVYRLQGTLAPREPEKDKDEDSPDDEDPPQEGLTIDPASSGHLEPRRVEGTIQAGFKLFARCYRDGLDRSPTLHGTIRFRFLVAPDGSVERVENHGSDLPDQWVIDCIAEGFYALRFPAPGSGRVDALYRIVFDSG